MLEKLEKRDQSFKADYLVFEPPGEIRQFSEADQKYLVKYFKEEIENLRERLVFPLAPKGEMLNEKEYINLQQQLLGLRHYALDKARERLRGEVDSLTGLRNRAALQTAYELELKRWNTTGGKEKKEKMALVYVRLDLDYLKAINDQHGHDEGDRILKEIGVHLLKCLRKTDTAGRIGGDEFILILPEVRQADAERVVKKILSHLEEIKTKEGQKISLSAGLTMVAHDQSPYFEKVDKEADQAALVAKQNGRGRLEIYDEERVKSMEIVKDNLSYRLELAQATHRLTGPLDPSDKLDHKIDSLLFKIAEILVQKAREKFLGDKKT